MKINLEHMLVDRSYRAQVGLPVRHAITPSELERLDQFGPLQIDIGGAIVDENDVTVATLSSSTVAVPVDLPISRDFSVDDYTGEGDTPTAAEVAEAWLYQMKIRINAALEALMALPVTSPTVTTVTLPLP